MVFGFYALLVLGKAVTTLGIFISPFLFMYTCGFFYISLKGIGESLDWITWKFGWLQSVKPAQAEEIDHG